MARMLCVWSPLWAIANWRRRNPSAWQDSAQSAGARPLRLGADSADPLPPDALRAGGREGNVDAPSFSSPVGGGGPRSGGGGLPQAQALAQSKLDGRSPLALIASERGVRRLSAVDEEGLALGLFVGQKATDAAALCPNLTTAEAEPEADAAALTALGDWCVRFSPAVAIDPPDGLILDITGVDHLWGGEGAMLHDLVTRLAANGVPVRGAIADTPGAAWALARCADDQAIAPPGGQAALLAPLPVAALRLERDTAAQISRLGLVTIGRLAGLPRGQITRRFGPAVVERLDQALGRAEEALRFRRPPTPWFTRLAFFE